MTTNNLRISKLASGAVIATALILGLSPTVAATPIVITQLPGPPPPTGNPGTQPAYEVSNLMVGDAFNLSWFYEVQTMNGDTVELSATGMVTVASADGGNLVLDIMLTNTSDMSTPDQSNLGIRLTIFGLGVSGIDTVTPFNAPADGTFLTNRDYSNFPGFGDLACATSGANCAGGGGGGIAASNSDMFTMDMNGTFDPNNIVLSQFAIKFQTGFDSDDDDSTDDSFELPGVPSRKPVPEPSSLIVLGLGLAGLGFFSPRARRKPGR